MKLSELFKKENVSLPIWVPDEYLKDDWGNSNYFKGKDIHKWELQTVFGLKIISIEKDYYTFRCYDENNQIIFEKIVTPEEIIIS